MAKSFLASMVTGSLAIHQGPLLIEKDGETIEVHVISDSPKGSLYRPNGRDLELSHGGETRGFLAFEAKDEMTQDNYYNFTFFNTELSYDINMAAVGCSCNAALFFTSMPGRNQDGTIAHGDNAPYYCDATGVGGFLCPEHDTIEGNIYTMATTPHKCNAPPGKYTTWCHQRGCQTQSFVVDPKAMCPDSTCTIDTSKTFKIVQSYEADSTLTKLETIRNRIVQGNQTFEWTVCNDAEYLEEFTVAFKANMSMVFQLWGTTWQTMAWLDETTGCKGDCDPATTTATFSNIAIRSLARSVDKEVDDLLVI